MLIDLHLHSKQSIPNGDSIKWLGYKEVLKLLVSNKYEAISFTDHSIFNYKQYKDMRDYVDNSIAIFPGIEINVRTQRGAIGNILYIFREDLNNEELKNLESITKKYLRKEGTSSENLDIAFKSFDILKIPHVGKSDYLDYEDLQKFGYDAFEATNLNHPNYKKVMKRMKKPVSTVAFSDTHIWTNFPQQDTLVTSIDIKDELLTFDTLKKVLKQNKNYTKEKYV